MCAKIVDELNPESGSFRIEPGSLVVKTLHQCFQARRLMSHNWLHTPDCRVSNQKRACPPALSSNLGRGMPLDQSMETVMALVTFQNSMAQPTPALNRTTVLVSLSSRYRKIINCSTPADQHNVGMALHSLLWQYETEMYLSVLQRVE